MEQPWERASLTQEQWEKERREDRGGGRKQRCLLQDEREGRGREILSKRDNKLEKDRGRERGRRGEKTWREKPEKKRVRGIEIGRGRGEMT